MVGDSRICCLCKRSVERHPHHCALQLATPKILEPVFRAFHGIKRHFASVLELRGGRLGAAHRQVAANAQVPVCIHAAREMRAQFREVVQEMAQDPQEFGENYPSEEYLMARFKNGVDGILHPDAKRSTTTRPA